MLCGGCGFTNLDDARFCSVCGKPLERHEPAMSTKPIGSIPCPSCHLLNDAIVSFCRHCGAKMPATNLIAASASGGENLDISAAANPFLAMDRSDEGEERSLPPLPSFVSSRHESFLAKLDRMEAELEARLKEPLPEPPTGVDEMLDEQEASLQTLSSTLDSLIADLLEVEINEYAYPDFIHPDESGFPSKDPAAYAPPVVVRRGRDIQEILVIIALIAAIFLVGLSVGLWGSYYWGL